LRLIRFLLLAVLVLHPAVQASEATKVVNGRVKKVLIDKQELILSYRHPVSGEPEELKLSIDGGTGFSKELRIEDFREDDLISADYQEDETGQARAVSVRRVDLYSAPVEKKPLLF